jgi:peptidoglycan/LPS O-acetylase OafA/YrhL
MTPDAPAATEPDSGHRLEYLDSIRGLAAFVVLLRHTIGTFAWPDWIFQWERWPILNNFLDGRSAVTMFFVLSGYVLAAPYLSPVVGGAAPRKLFLPTFYLRRFTRIWIPWAAIFAFSALAQAVLFRQWSIDPAVSSWMAQFWREPLTWPNVLRQCGFFLHDPLRLLLPQDWSLGVELKGSLLVPLFLLLIRKHTFFFWAFLGLLLFAIPTGAYYVSFGAGVLVARYGASILARLDTGCGSWKWAFFTAGCLFYQARYIASFFWQAEDLLVDKIVWCVTSVACACFLFSCIALRPLQKILLHRWLTNFGRISYSVYLLQFIVFLVVLPPFILACNRLGIREPVVLFPLSIVVSVAVTVGLSFIIYRWIELPSMQLGKWLTALCKQHLGQSLAWAHVSGRSYSTEPGLLQKKLTP